MKERNSHRRISRRTLVVISVMAGGAALMQACGAQAPAAIAVPSPAPTKPPTAPAPTAAPAAPAAAPTAAPAVVATQAPAAGQPTSAPAPAATPTTAAKAVKKGGTFTVARSASIMDFSGVWFTRGNYPFIKALYDTLITLDKQWNPQPCLAESWEFSPDGLTLTLKLRQGVKSHSGSEFTSENVKLSLEFGTSQDVGHGSQLRQLYTLVKQVKTPDKYTVQLVSDKPNPMIWDILDTLAMFDKTDLDSLAKKDAGCGPYMVTTYIPNSEIRMKRFPDYWNTNKGFVDEYVVKQIPDASSLVINLETKAVDAIEGAPFQEVARLGKNSALALHKMVAPPVMFHLGINPTRKPLDNKKVRQAINFAIDRDRFCKTVLQGTTEPTNLMFPKGSWAYAADLEGRYTYNLGKAKALLKEAGFESGFEIMMLTSKQMVNSMLGMAQIIQADLAKLNIKARISDIESTAYNLQWRNSDWDLVCHTYGRFNRDPGTMLQGAVAWYPKAEQGPIRFESEDFVKWRNEAATTLDRAKRKDLYRKIEEYVLDDSFSAQVAGEEAMYIAQTYVKDLSFTMESCPFVGDVWLDK